MNTKTSSKLDVGATALIGGALVLFATIFIMVIDQLCTAG